LVERRAEKKQPLRRREKSKGGISTTKKAYTKNEIKPLDSKRGCPQKKSGRPNKNNMVPETKTKPSRRKSGWGEKRSSARGKTELIKTLSPGQLGGHMTSQVSARARTNSHMMWGPTYTGRDLTNQRSEGGQYVARFQGLGGGVSQSGGRGRMMRTIRSAVL